MFVSQEIVLTNLAALLLHMATTETGGLETTKAPLGPLSSSSGYMPSISATRKRKSFRCLQYLY